MKATNPVQIRVTRHGEEWKLRIDPPFTDAQIQKQTHTWLAERCKEMEVAPTLRHEAHEALGRWLFIGRPDVGLHLHLELIKPNEGKGWLGKMLDAMIKPGDVVQKLGKKKPPTSCALCFMAGKWVCEHETLKKMTAASDESVREKHAQIFAEATCTRCLGKGSIGPIFNSAGEPKMHECPRCAGTGKV